MGTMKFFTQWWWLHNLNWVILHPTYKLILCHESKNITNMIPHVHIYKEMYWGEKLFMVKSQSNIKETLL